MDQAPPRKLLILDLDETLLFASETALERPPSFRAGPYHVYRRPHVEPFLEFCAARFDLAVWTASTHDYAACVVAELFGDRAALKFLWSRRRCTRRYDHDTREPYWVKDLKKVRRIGYALEQVIVVDDTARKHERNYGNLVHVRPFEGDPGDDELVHLRRYLDGLAGVDNVRKIEKRGWRARIEQGEA